MQPLGVHSIAFPPTWQRYRQIPDRGLGRGDGRGDQPIPVALQVSIMLMSRTLASPMKYLAFYEEFAQRVPRVAARDTKQSAPPLPTSPRQ